LLRGRGASGNNTSAIRNWLIGAYIHEYELHGADRAKYGENLVPELAKTLTAKGIPSCAPSSLYSYLTFYRFYPQILQSLTPKLQLYDMEGLMEDRIFQSVIGKSGNQLQVITDDDIPRHSGQEILEKLSYTHIFQLLSVDDPYKRVFYEMECLRGGWSVRELKRQISTLYFERTALSTNKAKLREIVKKRAESYEPRMVVRDPMVFEFLGVKPSEAVLEGEVEQRMLDRLQETLLEMGHGFCFEARQKRLLIGKEHFFVDLVFYHRILKCHVLVELKNDDFRHEYIGQLNTYLTWYTRNVMAEGDQPPVGILLCTGKDETLVEYALAGMSNNLFVSRYLAQLPTKEELLRIARDE
jgi:predicted nuclease of restriction endonuclease-like (RecB) superfamily